MQTAIRSYHQFANTPSIFDPHVDMDLSQHLFDIQMAKYMQRAKKQCASPVPHRTPNSKPIRTVERVVDVAEEMSATHNVRTGARFDDLNQQIQGIPDVRLDEAIEQSNRLAENANQLAERSNQLVEQRNQIAERANQLLERSGQPAEQSNRLAELFEHLDQHLERSNQQLERSNSLAEELTKPVAKLEDVLGNISKVLVRIQHAIVRNHKGNTLCALDCLANEKGETPIISKRTCESALKWLPWKSSHDPNNKLSVLINGAYHDLYFPDSSLGCFLRFYGISDELFENSEGTVLKPGTERLARELLRGYLSSCLG